MGGQPFSLFCFPIFSDYMNRSSESESQNEFDVRADYSDGKTIKISVRSSQFLNVHKMGINSVASIRIQSMCTKIKNCSISVVTFQFSTYKLYQKSFSIQKLSTFHI